MNAHSINSPAKHTLMKARTLRAAGTRGAGRGTSRRGVPAWINRFAGAPRNGVEQVLSIEEAIARVVADGPPQLYRGGA